MPTNRTSDTLSCVTWNIHRARGRDGRIDPSRIVDVIAGKIAAASPDVLVLQEADAETPPHAGLLDLDAVAAATGLRHAQADPALRLGPPSHGFHGVIVLLHPRLTVISGRLLDLPGHCHRGAVVLDLAPPGAGAIRLVATHLSLAQWLRALQMRTIGQHLHRSVPMDALLLGDLNEWRPWGGLALSRGVFGATLSGPVRPTFPAIWPVFPLDRALGTRPGMVRSTGVLDGPAIRAASDHRPLAAEVALRRTPMPP